MPSLEVKARRVGGSTYQVPMEVRPERRQTLGLDVYKRQNEYWAGFGGPFGHGRKGFGMENYDSRI